MTQVCTSSQVPDLLEYEIVMIINLNAQKLWLEQGVKEARDTLHLSSQIDGLTWLTWRFLNSSNQVIKMRALYNTQGPKESNDNIGGNKPKEWFTHTNEGTGRNKARRVFSPKTGQIYIKHWVPAKERQLHHHVLRNMNAIPAAAAAAASAARPQAATTAAFAHIREALPSDSH